MRRFRVTFYGESSQDEVEYDSEERAISAAETSVRESGYQSAEVYELVASIKREFKVVVERREQVKEVK